MLSLRDRVAREAALLLYQEQEKEYKQAKIEAAKMLGARVLPSNSEIADMLDKIADEIEGEERKKRLVAMREEALQIMKFLQSMHPVLIGSVWRGTAHKNSDIDVVVFHENPRAVLHVLNQNNFNVTNTEWQTVTKHGEKIQTFHINLILTSSNKAEIIVRDPERIKIKEKCEIYGDVQSGLNIQKLQRTLKTVPTKKFTPHEIF
ncbi:MAG: nucleotidyltransferase domain-containing protein [Candidatus Bathyarchaeales archaeon]